VTIKYEWRGDFDNAALNALHADGFGHPVAQTDWQERLQRHSLGWVCAQEYRRRETEPLHQVLAELAARGQ
jgi:hypothetical protein